MGLGELNHLMYYFLVVLTFLPWLVVIIGLMSLLFAKQIRNNKSRKALTITTGVAIIFVYLLRFIPLFIFAGLYNKNNFNTIKFTDFENIFTLLQFLIVAFIPSFVIIQSHIFNYQKIFTDNRKRSSANNQRIYLIAGAIATFGSLIILQIFKNLFSY